MDESLAHQLERAEQRLVALSAEQPSGLTEPDAGATERWDAGQVWAHIAEFVPYWQRQLEVVVGAHSAAPVPFGRTKTDPDRIATIERNRNAPIADQMAATRSSLSAFEAYLHGLSAEDWQAVGVHSVRGQMDVRAIVEFFVIHHLEEHVAQLDGLA